MASTLKLLGLAALAVATLGTASHAATLTDSYDDWASHVAGPVYGTTTLGSEYQELPTVNLTGGGSFKATDYYTGESVGSVATIGSGWGSWSGNYGGQVLFSSNTDGEATNYVTLSFSGLSAFGFEVQPSSQDSLYLMTVTLASGESLSDEVSGVGGAQFFGLYGGNIDSLTIQTEDNAFAFGNFVSSPGVSTVPLPASAPLFGLSLLALAGFGFARSRRTTAA